MLCYHCNENQADYRFLVNIMGNMGEVHLCGDCVKQFQQYAGSLFQDAHNHVQATGWNLSGAPVDAGQTDAPPRPLGEDPFPLDAGEDVKRRRKLNELKSQLRMAVSSENYERAAMLRDEIAKNEKGVRMYDT